MKKFLLIVMSLTLVCGVVLADDAASKKALSSAANTPTLGSVAEGLQAQIDEMKSLGLYDANLWNEFYGTTGSAVPTSTLDQGGEDCSNPTVITGLPYDDSGNTANNQNDYDAVCPFTGSTSPDVVYSFSPATDICVDISLCHDETGYDTKLYLYEDVCGEAYFACNDDGIGCTGYKSRIEGLTLGGGHTYYIVVDGYGGEFGAYRMTVETCATPCNVVCEDTDILEGEPACYDGYIDTYNPGCNVPAGTAPIYMPISCNTAICGTLGTYDTGSRDTDWYSLTLTEPTIVSWCVTSTALVRAFIIDITNGCADVDNHILGTDFTDFRCETACVELTLPAGIYAFWAGTNSFDGVPCGTVYRAWLTCETMIPCDVCQGNLYESGPLQFPIPDNGLITPCFADGGVSHTINVAPGSATILDVNVDVNITHTWIGDLEIVLEHGGVWVVLKSRALTGFGESCNNLYTTFDEQGTLWAPGDCPHDNGCFQTYDQHNCGNHLLSAFNGMPVAGTWTLYVSDDASGDTGTLDSWGLCIEQETVCDVPNPVVVDVSEGIPMCECIEACAGEPLILCFAPLTIDERPIEVRFDDGCTGDPFREAEILPGYGCEEMDCPPAYPDTVGEFYYDAALGGWCIIVVAQEDGCFCVCIDDILPVELIGFDAIAGDESVSLSWTTASEVDNDRFEILRDAAVVASVDANNSAAGSHYAWTDNYDLTNGREYSYSLVAISMDGIHETIGTVTATPTMSAATITEYALHQNYPNPFNPETNIIFDIVEAGNVSLTVYNPLGQTIATLVNGTVQSGRHTVSFDGASLPSGLYYYRLDAGDFSAVKKMILMK